MGKNCKFVNSQLLGQSKLAFPCLYPGTTRECIWPQMLTLYYIMIAIQINMPALSEKYKINKLYLLGISVPKVASNETSRSPIASVIRTTSSAAASMASVTTTKVVFGHNNTSTRHPIQTSLISSQPVSTNVFPKPYSVHTLKLNLT